MSPTPGATLSLVTSEPSWTATDLHQQLAVFERELQAAGLRESTILTYVDRAERFIKWLSGEYRPGG